MPRLRTSFVLIAALSLALLAFAGCSKKTEETPKAAATAASATTAPAKASATAGASSASGPAGGVPAITSATFAKAICQDYKSIAGAVPGAGGPPTSASSANVDAAGTQALMKQMMDAAPAELKPDFTVMAKFVGEYAAAMSRAGGDMMKLAQDAQFMQTMQTGSADVEKASKNIEVWQQKNCH